MVKEKRTIKIYKTISGWKIGSEMEKDATSNRKIAKLVLGEIRNGQDLENYIVEDIYKDLLDSIADNPHDYDISVKINMTPQLIITYDGVLIPHNSHIKKHLEDIVHVLENIPISYIMDAYLEMRLNMNGKSKLKESSNMITAMIQKESGKNYAVPFLRTAICQRVENKFFNTEDDEWKDFIRSLSYEELVIYTNEIVRYKYTGEVTIDVLDEHLSLSHDSNNTIQFMNSLENIIEKELLFRLYKGTLKER